MRKMYETILDNKGQFAAGFVLVTAGACILLMALHLGHMYNQLSGVGISQ